MDAEALALRDVLVAPLATADARSATNIVIMSSTRLARSSRVKSKKAASGDQIEPGED